MFSFRVSAALTMSAARAATTRDQRTQMFICAYGAADDRRKRAMPKPGYHHARHTGRGSVMRVTLRAMPRAAPLRLRRCTPMRGDFHLRFHTPPRAFAGHSMIRRAALSKTPRHAITPAPPRRLPGCCVDARHADAARFSLPLTLPAAARASADPLMLPPRFSVIDAFRLILPLPPAPY